MKIILHGVLAERFGREHIIKTNVPAEAIEGLSRQIPDWPRDMAVDVIGFTSEEALRAPTDKQEIHILPGMFGGGGVTKILIGTALIIGGVILLGVPGGQVWGVSLIMTGASLALTGISELMMKAPTNDKSNDPPASKYLGINRNTVSVGTPIINAWGRVKLAGHWLSLQSDSNQLVTTSFPETTT